MQQHRNPYSYIAIEGNIGAGKTTLATRIAEAFNARLILEQFEDNPFLPKFYEDPSKYAFPLELSFLASRYQQLTDQFSGMDLFKAFTISDYFIHKSLIFSRRTLEQDEYNLYSRLFGIMMHSLPRPDLLVFLHMETSRLQANIRNRGRDYEQQITNAYLESIQQSYFEHLKTLKGMRILIIDTNHADLMHSGQQYGQFLEMIFSAWEPGLHRLAIK